MVVVAFSSYAGILGKCSTSFEVEISHTHKFHSLGQDQSTVAQWAEMTVTKSSLFLITFELKGVIHRKAATKECCLW